jgi:hypothetical protein
MRRREGFSKLKGRSFGKVRRKAIEYWRKKREQRYPIRRVQRGEEDLKKKEEAPSKHIVEYLESIPFFEGRGNFVKASFTKT